MERDSLSGIELIAVALGGAAALLVGVVWLGAVIALAVTGQTVDVSLRDAASALGELPGNVADPAAAWPRPAGSEMPGPLVYWPATFAAAVAATGAGAVALRLFGGSRVGTARRRILGVDSKARFATGRDLTPLLVREPAPGRFVLARFGRRLVATEAPSRQRRRRARWRRRSARWGNRGAVALVGPSQCGKTTAAVAGILEWDGPAVLSSVKADLMGPTLGWRERLGDVRIYDPTASTGRAATASWSPIYQAGTITGAQRSARALCDAAPRDGVEGGMDFWLAQAEILLSALLFVAHHTHQDMRAVANWVLLQDRPIDGKPGQVRTLLNMLLSARDRELVAAAEDVARGLVAVWSMEDRTRSSVYATAQTVVWPWSDPGVAAASRGEGRVDLDWLLGGGNTVFLCAPIEDQKRLAPAFGGLLNDLVAQTYRRVAATGKPLDPPLLVVIDEAGNTPLRQLPEYASTLSGIGVLLVTIWQSLAQIETTYGRSSSTILTNHLTKLFYSGLSDASTLDYVRQVLGDAEVETRSRSAERLGRGSTQFATTNVAMAPVHVVRQMRPGDALLIHGTLPPAHVRTRPFYNEPQLVARTTTATATAPVEAQHATQPLAATAPPHPRALIATAEALMAKQGGRR